MIELRIGDLLIQDDCFEDVKEFARYIMRCGKVKVLKDHEFVYESIGQVEVVIHNVIETPAEGSPCEVS